MKSRDLEIARLPVGTRVRHDRGKWEPCANSVRFVPEWTSLPGAETRLGTAGPTTLLAGHIYPETHPWGIPAWATVVQWDDGSRPSWVRTSCLEIVETVEAVREGQAELNLIAD